MTIDLQGPKSGDKGHDMSRHGHDMHGIDFYAPLRYGCFQK